MRTIALLVIFSFQTQVTKRPPVIVEVKQDVEVIHDGVSCQSRGKLCLEDGKQKEFRLTKGQRFQMIETGDEGSCRIKFEDKEYGLASCPWREGFRDHQTDIFGIVLYKK